MTDSPFIAPIAFALAWMPITWIRAAYGSKSPFFRRRLAQATPHTGSPPMFQKMMDKKKGADAHPFILNYG